MQLDMTKKNVHWDVKNQIKQTGKVFNACVRCGLLHGSETWAPSSPDLQHLHQNNRVMGPQQSPKLESCKAGDTGGDDRLHIRRLRWCGHVWNLKMPLIASFVKGE